MLTLSAHVDLLCLLNTILFNKGMKGKVTAAGIKEFFSKVPQTSANFHFSDVAIVHNIERNRTELFPGKLQTDTLVQIGSKRLDARRTEGSSRY